MGEAGGFGDGRPALLSSDVGQGLVAARCSIRVIPAGLREALVTAAVSVGLVLAAARRPEGQRGFALPLDRQVVVSRRGGVLVVEGGGRVWRVTPGLLRVPDDTGLRLVALGRYVEGLWRVGADGGRRGAGGRGRRGCRGGWRRASRRRRVGFFVQRAADPVHHGPPGRPGGVAGCGRWRRGRRVAGRAEAPDMVVRVQGGGRASHGGSG